MPGVTGAPAAGQHELSPGELRVLRYLPTNLSRPQIATELSVSINTVSTHIRSIYAKLGAEDRSAAVHRARDAAAPLCHRDPVMRVHPAGSDSRAYGGW